MSIILDALRKAQREKKALPSWVEAERRRAQSGSALADGFFKDRPSGLMVAAAVAAFAGGFCFAAGTAGQNPLRPVAAEAMTMDNAAVTVSTAVEPKEKARRGVEETPGTADPAREQGAGPRGEKGEVSPRPTAGPGLSLPIERDEPAGTEPPARPRAQAAPAPVFFLEGIVFHDDPARRAALLRVSGGESVLLNIGGRIGGCRVESIAGSVVVLARSGGKKIELALD